MRLGRMGVGTEAPTLGIGRETCMITTSLTGSHTS
jgi:hypothetical protein